MRYLENLTGEISRTISKQILYSGHLYFVKLSNKEIHKMTKECGHPQIMKFAGGKGIRYASYCTQSLEPVL
jgi:hypothetical protein